MTSIPVTQARSKLYQLVDDASSTHVPVQITGNATTQSRVGRGLAKHPGNTLSRIYPGMRDSIRKGLKEPLSSLQRPLMVNWELYFTKQAQKDAKKVASTNLRPQVERLLEILKTDPFQNPPPFEKLVGDLTVRILGG